MSIQTVELPGEKPLVTLGLHRALRYDTEIMNYQKEEQGTEELVGAYACPISSNTHTSCVVHRQSQSRGDGCRSLRLNSAT